MSLDQRAKILEAATLAPFGTRELVRTLGWQTSKVIAFLKKMHDEGLIELKPVAPSRRGRPKKIITDTPLGLEFLATHKNLRLKPLRARKQDFEHAIKDALYSKRLTDFGHSPFRLFMELNTIADNIKVSSKAS